MPELRIYHLTAQSVKDGLPGLISTAIGRDLRCHIYVPDASRAEDICDHLWTFDQDSFIPHGTKKDGLQPYQPVWISPDLENPNNSNVRFVMAGADITPDDLNTMDLTCVLFDESDTAARQKARQLWADSDDDDTIKRIYYRQDETGQWHESG